MYKGLGAIKANSMCWSKGNESVLLLYFLYAETNQCGNRSLRSLTVSLYDLFDKAAPPSPDSFDITIEKRESDAPAHKAAFPSLECPTSTTLLASTDLSCCR